MPIVRIFFFITILAVIPLCTMTEEFRPVWRSWDLDAIQSFHSPQKIVGTHYFYWYDYPAHHFFDNAEYTDDGLQDHFPAAEAVSFNSIDWHEKQLDDCTAAGIDFILPVYWGVVDHYFAQGIVFSIRGLGPLQTAMERRKREGKPSPKIGLFYDTSTLLPGVRGVAGRTERYDLREAEGKDIFYRTIRDFFYQVNPRHWAAIDGRPLIVFYSSGFAAFHNQSTIDYVYARFQRDFNGIRPYIIKDNSWGFSVDGITQWGAALSGPCVFDRVAQLGPGYNDSAVPGRSTPIRDRENGNFYRKSWIDVLNSNARIALIETWNEMHEGTDICDSLEYGRQYIEMTRAYADRFKRNEKSDEEITLQYPDLRPRPPSEEGDEYRDQRVVRVSLGRGGKEEGIRLVRGQQDGPVEEAEIDGVSCVKTPSAGNTYLYFSVADPFYYDDRETLTFAYTFWDEGFERHVLQYDSHDHSATLDGAYKDTALVQCANSKRWITNTIRLQDARFVNRENGGADFRFAAAGGWLAVKEIVISKDSAVR
ncbi:MAG: hypothetical protein C4527_22945 [Candidatus Omnitrophota bacterium]|jgi:hypothetical protein|nr:MAG: hypothetical protein C4527_22945 [Candidatus Omnitrophota bacterium]